jgi:GTP-binding protein YchF
MDVAIIGLPQSGKTTVFNALTHGNADTTGGSGSASELHVGVVKVPDTRLDILAEMYYPRKIVQAEIKYWDLPGGDPTRRSQGISGQHRNILQGADAFLLLVRTFANPSVAHHLGEVDPGRDLKTMLTELAFADLESMERAVERLEDNIKKSKPAERPLFQRHLEAAQKVKRGLEADVPLRNQQLTESEAAFIANYQLFTGKPIIVCFNTGDAGPECRLGQLALQPEQAYGLGQVNLPGKLEAELALMPEDEAWEFRRDLELDDPATSKVIQESYHTLGLVSFLTVGDDEVRAWSVPNGLPAQEAAGTIHTDFYRGFIRAEVIPYYDLTRCGSIAQGRKEGVLRSEGKTYPVKDGDVINFLVNV